MRRKLLTACALLLFTLPALQCAISETAAERDSRLRQAARERWHTWRKSRTRFPIAAWSYFHRYESTQHDYDLYGQAGMTMIAAPPEQQNLAANSGLDLILGHFQPLHEDKALLKKAVLAEGVDPARVTAYSLKDEPLVGDYPGLSRAVEYIYMNDTHDAIPIMDFRPNWSVPYKRWNMTYETYFERFIDKVHPAVLLNCHYAVMRDGSTRPVFYANIEYFRKKALEYDIGLMGFVLITAHSFPDNPNIDYRMPSESDIRWMAYTYLAYGAQGIWWYNWRIRDERFRTSIIDGETGEPSRYYPIVAAVNRELQDIGPTLLSLRSTGIYHIGENTPQGTTRYADGVIPSLWDLEGEDFLVGMFEHTDNTDDSSVYLMFVNKRHEADTGPSELAAALSFTAHPDFTDITAISKDNGHFSLNSTENNDGVTKVRLSLDGGQGILLRCGKKR